MGNMIGNRSSGEDTSLSSENVATYGAIGGSEVVGERPKDGESDDVLIEGAITRHSRRWDLLCLLSVMGLLQTSVWNSWGPLACTVGVLYDWGPHTVAQLANHGPAMYLLMLAPVCLLLHRSLRSGLLLATGSITLGTFIRASCLPAPGTDPYMFTVVSHLCSLLNGVASTLLGSGTLSLVFVWFSGEELRTALTISQIFFSLGPGVSFLMAAQMVEPLESVTGNHNVTQKILELSEDMQWYLYSQAIPAGILFIFIVVYFPSGSSRQGTRQGLRELTESLLREGEALVRNKKAWLICLASAIPQGVVRAWLAVSVISLTQVCQDGTCLPQSWVNTLAIIACVASIVAGMAAVRMVVVTAKQLQLTVILLYLGACTTFIFLVLVSHHILPAPTLVNIQISILFLFVTGYSLVISSVPLTLKIATDLLRPVDTSLVCYWMTVWTNVVSLLFLAVISVPEMSNKWLTVALPVSSGTGLALFLPLII